MAEVTDPKPEKGAFTISNAPTVSGLALPSFAEIEGELPSYDGESLFLAVPRNPRELFVCWAVDWETEFAQGRPADRKAHVKITGDDGERFVAVEPMRGSALVDQLHPGGTYQLELGYFWPAGTWKKVTSGHEVLMPLTGAEAVGDEYVTLPLHLSYQRILESFGLGSKEESIPHLARWEKAMAMGENLGRQEAGLFRSLNLTPEQLQLGAEQEELLRRTRLVSVSRTVSSSPAEWPS